MKKITENIVELMFLVGICCLGYGLYLRHGLDVALITSGGVVTSFSMFLIAIVNFNSGKIVEGEE